MSIHEYPHAREFKDDKKGVRVRLRLSGFDVD